MKAEIFVIIFGMILLFFATLGYEWLNNALLQVRM